MSKISPLNLRWHSANAVVEQSMFFLAKFCCCDTFDANGKSHCNTNKCLYSLLDTVSQAFSLTNDVIYTLMLQAWCNGFK